MLKTSVRQIFRNMSGVSIPTCKNSSQSVYGQWTSKSNIKDKISSLENTWQIADLMTALNELLTVSIKPISIHLYDTCRLMCSLSVDKGVKRSLSTFLAKRWLKVH